uniref:Uncharacterized protein n=1 Tax=Octopus bimaculoides TaxID=37653 RepID=A0A0L8I1H1_OCTBM
MFKRQLSMSSYMMFYVWSRHSAFKWSVFRPVVKVVRFTIGTTAKLKLLRNFFWSQNQIPLLTFLQFHCTSWHWLHYQEFLPTPFQNIYMMKVFPA